MPKEISYGAVIFRREEKHTKQIYLYTYFIYIYINMGSETIQINKEKVKHSPTLNTVLMVEEVLKNVGELITVAELKRKLPKKVMHQTLIEILDYLQFSGKIIIGTKGILWIFTERKELEAMINRGTEL